MPSFSRLQTAYAANGVQFVGIALDTSENVAAFSKQFPVSYPLLMADSEGMELTKQLGNTQMALPYTVVLGAGGEVHLTRLGRLPEQELDVLLRKASQR
jgi:peroxiredoxin